MILDRLVNSAKYNFLGERFAKAFEYLKKTDFNSIEPGRYEIDGTSVYVLVQDYTTKAMSEAFIEAHYKYADVQFVCKGEERFGYSNILKLAAGPYDEEREFYKLEGEIDFVSLSEGYFAIFFPEDAHMPGLYKDEPSRVIKAVVKVRLDN